MLRWLASAVILALLALDLALPATPIGRRGHEAKLRADVPGAFGRVGEPFPDFELRDVDGVPVRVADYRGHPLLITFERSVDW